jgi:hypothetical protein
LSARIKVTVWKRPYALGNPPVATFSLEQAAALTGLSVVWLRFVLQHSKPRAWDTAEWHIEEVAEQPRCADASPP